MFHRESGVFKTTYGADMALYPLPIAKWTVVALAAIFVVIIPLAVHEYYLSVLNLIFIAIVGALGLNILVGYTGQISIGHGAFMSVGAYTAANLAVRLDLPFWITLPAGGLMAALIGVIVGMPSLRIKGLYLAIATLAGQLIIEWTINHVPAISGGAQASIEVPRPSLFGFSFNTQGSLYFFLLFFAVIAIVATLNLVRSRIGRAFVAVRDQDIAAEIIGINIYRYKLLAFAISSFYAGVLRRALHLLFRHRQLRAVPAHRLDRLPRHDHHRRAGLGAGVDLRGDFRHIAAHRDPYFHGGCGVAVFHHGGDGQCHLRPAAGRIRRAHHLLFDRRARGAQSTVEEYPELFPGLALLLLERGIAAKGRNP